MTVVGAKTLGAWNDLHLSQQPRGASPDAPTATNGLTLPLPPSPSSPSSSETAALLNDLQVTLSSRISVADSVYTKPVPRTPTIVWASDPADDISQLMLGNVTGKPNGAGNTSSLLYGLGAKLLERFSTSQSNFKQSIVAYKNLQGKGTAPGYSSTDVSHTTSVDALKQAEGAPNRVDFKTQTLTGKTVHVSIAYSLDGQDSQSSLNVEATVDGGQLTDAEQKAVAKLSKGFETALQSAIQGQGKVDISGLLDYDATALSSVDLTVRQTPQNGSTLKSLDFHADAKNRSFAIDATNSHLSLTVDLSQPKLWGSSAQRQTAVQNYLSQFDGANQRGRGDSALLNQFKDVFSQLHSSYPTTNNSALQAFGPLGLNDKDRSVLTGLADFTASMSGDFHHGTTEAGHLDYQVSQDSILVGTDKLQGLSLTQTQTARLKSVFQTSRNGAMLDIKSGNYDSTSINDETTSTTIFAYAELKLKSATVTLVANQLEQWKRLVNHKTVDERNTPGNKISVQDISARFDLVVEAISTTPKDDSAKS